MVIRRCPHGVPAVEREGPRAQGLHPGCEADSLSVENLVADTVPGLRLAQVSY